MAGPLTGRTIVVTRPRAQAEGLVQGIEALGGAVIRFPLLEIVPTDDPAPLAQTVAGLADFALAIFISPNAVDYSLPAIQAAGGWPEGLLPAAVGQGTVRALAAHGIKGCVAPTERFDSEALLALPELAPARVQGRRVALFKGEGGRDLLAETLMARGATVVPVSCYKRLGPSTDVSLLMVAWRARALDAFTVSSSEGLRHLVDVLDPEGRSHLAQTPIFVPHPRIAEQAAALGLPHSILTEAADDGILTGLAAHPWPEAQPNTP